MRLCKLEQALAFYNVENHLPFKVVAPSAVLNETEFSFNLYNCPAGKSAL